MKYFIAAALLFSTVAFAEAPHAYLAQYVALEVQYQDGKFFSVQAIDTPYASFHECVVAVTKVVKEQNDKSPKNIKLLGQCLPIADLTTELTPTPSERHQKDSNTTEL